MHGARFTLRNKQSQRTFAQSQSQRSQTAGHSDDAADSLEVMQARQTLRDLTSLKLNEDVRDEIARTQSLIKAPVAEFEAQFSQSVPPSKQPEMTREEAARDNPLCLVQPASLAEAQLLSKYQLMDVALVGLMGHVTPLLQHTFKLVQVSSDASQYSSQEEQQHRQSVDADRFESMLASKALPVVQLVAQDYLQASARAFMDFMQEQRLSEEMRSQEVSLMKHDFLFDELADAAIIGESHERKLQVLDIFKRLHEAYPREDGIQHVKTEVIGDMIELPEFDTKRAEARVAALKDLRTKTARLKQQVLARQRALLEELGC